MILIPSIEADVPEIGTWVAADPWHNALGNDFWITGSSGCLFACKLIDDCGTVCYVRVDEEANSYRLHTQFAPEHVVSRSRVVRMALKFFDVLSKLAKANGKQYITTESKSPDLIAFLERLGWKAAQADNFSLEVI